MVRRDTPLLVVEAVHAASPPLLTPFRRRRERCEPGWLEALRQLPAAQLAAVPGGHTEPGWPPSLLAFVREAQELSLLGQPDGGSRDSSPPPCVCTPALCRALAEGLGAKKRHEVSAPRGAGGDGARADNPASQVDALASLVAHVARESRADVVLDVGAGAGHLACSLAFQHGLRVLALDAVAPLTAACLTRAQRLSRLTRGCAAHGELLAAVPARVCWGSEEGAEQLTALLREHVPGSPRVLLVGLHACGDLSPAIMRTFVRLECCVGVVAVPCCHNLLSEQHPSGRAPERAAADAILRSTAAAGGGDVAAALESACGEPGFPMSCAGAGLALGRRARMLACQSGERWRALPAGTEDEAARRTAFRAALEVVLRRHFPELDASSTPSLKGAPPARAAEGAAEAAAFAAAALQTLARAGLGERAGVDAATLSALWADELAAAAPLVAPFCALRAVLAAPLESLIELDRLLFLREQLGGRGSAASLPVFDPAISPRNICLVATK